MLMWGGLTQLPPFHHHPQPRHKRSPCRLQGSPGFIREWRGRARVLRPPTLLPARVPVKSLPGQRLATQAGRSLRGADWSSGGPSGRPPQRMIWLVKLRLSSLCGRTIEFRMSTSAGIRTRQPAVWTRAPGRSHGDGRRGAMSWGPLPSGGAVDPSLPICAPCDLHRT